MAQFLAKAGAAKLSDSGFDEREMQKSEAAELLIVAALLPR